MEEYSGAKSMEESACRDINMNISAALHSKEFQEELVKTVVEKAKELGSLEKVEELLEKNLKEWKKQRSPYTATGENLRRYLKNIGFNFDKNEKDDEVIRKEWLKSLPDWQREQKIYIPFMMY